MKNATQFFIEYYYKKHLGFLFGKSLDATDVFWKNFFRLQAHFPIQILEQTTESMLLQATVAEKQFKCYVRNAPSSDLYVFRQIFENKEYLPLVNLLQKNKHFTAPSLIIDAGANVGFTAVYLKQFFPDALIVAIEPDKLNAAQLQLNLAANNISKTELVVAGVWSHDCWLELKKDKSKGEDWGFYVEESNLPTDLKAIDILNLPQLNNGQLIDILKLDIEGSEAQLFADTSKAGRLLSITKYLTIEIHDDMADRKHIQQVLKANNFSWFETGELTIATNHHLIKD